MARPRSRHVADVKRKLLERLADPLRQPGAPFSSARSVAASYGISYQTAHRLLSELQAEGKVSRRAASGTFGIGRAKQLAGVQLLFSERARRPGSFGNRLLTELQTRLRSENVDVRVTTTASAKLAGDRLPVLCESPVSLEACLRQKRTALLLNDRPTPGMNALHIDSVGVDDFSGGALAGELLKQHLQSENNLVVLAGPKHDRRSAARVAGFQSKLGTKAKVVWAGGWYLQNGLSVAQRVLDANPGGIFCCNDRLAESLYTVASQRPRPAVIGFDDAPVASQLGLTTIAIPWDELVSAAVQIVHARLAGDTALASHRILTPRPCIRWTADSRFRGIQ